MKKHRYYVAYGSNLNLRQMRIRCPGARPVTTEMLKDYRLVFRGSRTGSYLTIEKARGSVVPVALFAVTEADEAALDRYEGFPRFYRKELIHLSDHPAGIKEAFVYIMNPERPYGMPSAHYLRICEEGYDDFGFDTKYLLEAMRESEARI